MKCFFYEVKPKKDSWENKYILCLVINQSSLDFG